MGTNLTKEKMKEVDKVVKACEKMVKSNQKRREKGLGGGLKGALKSGCFAPVFVIADRWGGGPTWSKTNEITYTIVIKENEDKDVCVYGVVEDFLSEDEKTEYHKILKVQKLPWEIL